METTNFFLKILFFQTWLEGLRRKNFILKSICISNRRLFNLLKKDKLIEKSIEFVSKEWQNLGFEYSVGIISFDCDLKEDYEALPTVLNILKKEGIKASFAIIGKWIEIYPKIHKRILEEGHEIINHTYTHPNNKYFSPDKKMVNFSIQEKREEIYRCHEVCEKFLRYSPCGYRAPHLGSSHGKEIYPVLKELGYKYSSSDVALRFRSLGAPFKIKEIWEFPLTVSSRNIFETPSTSLVRDQIITEEEYYSDIQNIITMLKGPFYFNIYCDPMDVVKMLKFDIVLKELKGIMKLITYKKLNKLLENINGKN